MPAICPKCQQPLQLEQIPLKKDVEATCSSCQAVLTVSLVVTPAAGSARGGVSLFLNNKKVVAAVEGDASQEMIREILAEGGFEMVVADPALDLLAVLQRERPAVVIVDVGILDIIGFEIADRIKNRADLKEIAIILLASIHDKTRYKREPDSLYGAQDYIERHHIQDQLLPKMQRILGARIPAAVPKVDAPSSAGPATAAPETASARPSPKVQGLEQAMSIENVFDSMVEEERRPAARPAAPKAKAESKPPGDAAAHAAAKRLARIIISDIALYNQRAVEEGVRNGSLYDVLRDEIEEGRKLYEGRVPSDIASSTDYYREAIDEFVRKRKMEMQKPA
jgi:CheY-like chemotaxis protein